MSDSNEIYDIQSGGQATALKFTSFENAKTQLRTFSTRNSGDFGIDKVETDGGFLWLGDHKVTGTELNKVTSQVQDYLIKINDFSKDVVKEIGHVYAALESLDKEYIPAIMTAVKGAEIASDQAKAASEHARVAQEDIKDTIQKQKKIVGVLEKHKEKLDKLKHLDNIDEIWKESKELEKEMDDFQKKFAEAKEQLANFEKSIKSLQSFANSILDYEHLEDIDEMWDHVSSIDEELNLSISKLKEVGDAVDGILRIPHINDLDYFWDELENKKKEVALLTERTSTQKEELDQARADIKLLQEFECTLNAQEHILDIDECWKDIQKAKEDIKDSTSRIDSVDDLIEQMGTESKQQLEIIHELQEELKQQNQQSIEVKEMMLNKIKIAYLISGGAVGLTIIQFILNIMGVL